jgi:hypothetical protein
MLVEYVIGNGNYKNQTVENDMGNCYLLWIASQARNDGRQPTSSYVCRAKNKERKMEFIKMRLKRQNV